MVTLDKLEFRTPITVLERSNGTKKELYVQSEWQRRLKNLWAYVQQPRAVQALDSDVTLSPSQTRTVLLADGTFTITLPESAPGTSYYVFNNGLGVITIAGTINGNPAGYQLTAQYKYAEFTSVAPMTWIVTLNN